MSRGKRDQKSLTAGHSYERSRQVRRQQDVPRRQRLLQRTARVAANGQYPLPLSSGRDGKETGTKFVYIDLTSRSCEVRLTVQVLKGGVAGVDRTHHSGRPSLGRKRH